tara:strand:- start:7505 stop:8509 length:1005 start_codon:yes stop_codon:yes gene_type:complete
LQKHNRSGTVAILAFDGSMEMSVALARDIFYAGAVALRHQGVPGQSEKRVLVASETGKPVTTFNGSLLQPNCSIDELDQPELIIVSGIWDGVETVVEKYRKTVDWLRGQAKGGARIACLHTGTFLMAETGLLDGKSATIYWRMVDLFRNRYPRVILQPEKNLTVAENLYCSSGVFSGFEMAMYLIEKLWGMHAASRVSRHFMMDAPKPSAEFELAMTAKKQHDDKKVKLAQEWIENNFSSNFLLEELADRLGLSLRSLRRRFKEATGETPMQYLQDVRLETAKQLLTSDILSVDQVGYRVGYDDRSYFSRLFKQKTKLSPGEYRKAAFKDEQGA